MKVLLRIAQITLEEIEHLEEIAIPRLTENHLEKLNRPFNKYGD